MIRLIVHLLGAISLLLSAANAQQILPLNPNFIPDPTELRGTSSGNDSAFERFNGEDCKGLINTTPDVILELGSFEFLRLFVVSRGNATLVIRQLSPGERVFCNDDFDGFHPQLAGAFDAGLYEVYVGRRNQREALAFQLFITEFVR